ncbi:MAG: ATP-binding protein [Longimicrobiales bacterium]
MPTRHVLELENDLGDVEPVVDFVLDRCREAGFDERRLRLNLRVGVTEALVNAILYGNGRDPAKHVRIELRVEPEAVTVRVTDEGSGFDPEALPDPTLPHRRRQPGGRGVFLIRQLMDRVEFNDLGNSITMTLWAHDGLGRASG